MKLIHRYITFLLAVAMMLNALVMPLIYIDFKINQDYIAKVLCINRDKPITTCGGQCFLNKQLKEQQKQEQAPENQASKKQSFDTYYQLLFDFEALAFTEKAVYFIPYKNLFTSQFLFSVFHPPQLHG